jgi:hypothetical protein
MVKYEIGGRAENGVDYEKLAGEVEIPAGRESARIVVQPLADELVEGTETVVIELVSLPFITIWPPPPGYYQVGELGRAVAKILDVQPAENRPPKIEIVKPCAGEVFQVPAEIRIVAMAADSDGKVVQVEFYADGNKIGEQFPPDPGATGTDPDRSAFTLTWSGPTAGRHVLWAVAKDDRGATGRSCEVPIVVLGATETPVVRIVAVDPYAAERPATVPPNTATFKVQRTGHLAQELRVFYSVHGTAENGKDYRELESSVLIPAGRRSATVVVEPIADEEVERVETVILKLEPSPTMGPLEPYRIGWPARACAVIVDQEWVREALRPLPEDVAHVCLPGETGLPYRIEASDNLVDWIPVADAVAVEGRVQFAEPGMREFGHRFYRVRPLVMEALGLDE